MQSNCARIVKGAETPNGTLIIKFVSDSDIEVVSDIRTTIDGERGERMFIQK